MMSLPESGQRRNRSTQLWSWSLLLLALVGGLVPAGCRSSPPPVNMETVKIVSIRDVIDPLSFRADVGDEIQWQNEREEPVQLGLLEVRGLEDLSCNKGFSHLGRFTDLIIIAPHESASLCFSKPATIRYNVWLDLNDRRHSMTPTGHIRIN